MRQRASQQCVAYKLVLRQFSCSQLHVMHELKHMQFSLPRKTLGHLVHSRSKEKRLVWQRQSIHPLVPFFHTVPERCLMLPFLPLLFPKSLHPSLLRLHDKTRLYPLQLLIIFHHHQMPRTQSSPESPQIQTRNIFAFRDAIDIEHVWSEACTFSPVTAYLQHQEATANRSCWWPGSIRRHPL